MPDSIDRDYLDKTLQQFESHPYPDVPIEDPLNKNIGKLYNDSLVTARYRRDKTVITDLENRAILDVACGTGATTLQLAWANPGAKIVGVDISPESIKIAEKRLNYHGFDDAEFHVLAIEDLEQLAQKFDLINASDVLYLLPDQGFALQQMGRVLKQDGIIRGNLHSFYQRMNYFRSQKLFQRMGLMEESPGETEMEIVREFFGALKDGVDLKARAWPTDPKFGNNPSCLLSNHLLINDKGFTIPQLLEYLEQAGLELISMVDWKNWDWRKLFKEPDNLPAYLAMGLEESSLEEQLCFYELVQPDKRLLDFWCGQPPSENRIQTDWQDSGSEEITVHIAPALKTDDFRKDVLAKDSLSPIDLMEFFPFLNQDSVLDRTLMTAVYGPLLSAPRPLIFLVERFLAIRPLNPVTMVPVEPQEAEDLLRRFIKEHEEWGLLMVEVKK